MSKRYDKSFSNIGSAPKECPICKSEIDFQEDIDISPYKEGYRTMLFCPKCNYKKVLAFDRRVDIEKEINEDDNGV